MERKTPLKISLEPEQYAVLCRLAEIQGRSVSDVIREIIGIGLAVIQNEEETLWRRRILAIERLGKVREAIRKRNGIYSGNLVAEARSLRNHQIESVWNSE